MISLLIAWLPEDACFGLLALSTLLAYLDHDMNCSTTSDYSSISVDDFLDFELWFGLE